MRPLYTKPTALNYNEISKYINNIDVTLPIDVCDAESVPCVPCNSCSGYCLESVGFFCGENCMCSEEPLGVQCFYRVAAGGGECGEECYPDPDAPGWCVCMDIVSFDDCVFTYDGKPPGYPMTPEEEAGCAPHREQYGVCGGSFGFDVFRCVPDTGGNPLP